MEQYPIYELDQKICSDLFRHIPQPPKKLFIRGVFPTESNNIFLTIVGSRSATTYGHQVCKHLIEGLRGYPIIIVSGLAHGIDCIVHESALETGLVPLAFPGSGLGEKSLYPRYNYRLAQKILECGGALVSEYEENTTPQQWMFPKRNRLMAGLSRATLVIECEHKSGTRITARLATEYNRDVLAVPGNIFSQKSEGPNELIRLGATPITCSQDILEALGFDIDLIKPNELLSRCTEEEKSIINLLGSPLSRSELIRQSNLPIHKANILISQMELKGFIKESNGQIYKN